MVRMCRNGYIPVPHRGEIWLGIDWDEGHNGINTKYDSSVQGGTRPCIIVSSDELNKHGQTVEVVYITTKDKGDQPTHFMTDATPRPSTVLCEQIMTIPKASLKRQYGTLSYSEEQELDRCLEISVELIGVTKERLRADVPHRGEIWLMDDARGRKGWTGSCVIVSNNVGNRYAPVVEAVPIMEKGSVKCPAHFMIDRDTVPSIVQCDRIMTIPKKELARCYRTLTKKEAGEMDRCLRISLGL